MSSECADNPLSDRAIDAYKWISAVSGTTSIIGSSLIILIVLRGRNLSKIRNRILLGMCIVDLFSSSAYALSFIPTPQVSECSNGIGNLSTCAVQGFFLQIGLAGPAYNAVLSIYYLLTIRYAMTQRMIAKKYELTMHVYAVVPAVITATIGVTNDMYFGQWGPCWFSSSDGRSWGDGYWIVMFSTIYTGINIVCTIICMMAIYLSLHKINNANERHDFRRNSVQSVQSTQSMQRRQSQSEFAANESFKQALLYFCAFILTYSFLAVSIIFGGNIWTLLWPYLFSATFQPLQGFWNFWAFVRPIISATQRRNRNDNVSFMSALMQILLGRNEVPNERRINTRNLNHIGSPAIISASGVSDSSARAGSSSHDSSPDDNMRTDNTVSTNSANNSIEVNNV